MENLTLAQSQHKAAHTQKVASGRGYILLVAILQLVLGGVILVLAGTAEEASTEALIASGIVVAVLGLIFLGLWIWAKRQPFPAALTALIIYLTVHAAEAVMDPTTLMQGLLIKILIIAGLIKAVQSGYALRKQ